MFVFFVDFFFFQSLVKKTGILGQGSVAPTIIEPYEYSKRFLDSVKTYFTSIPSRHSFAQIPFDIDHLDDDAEEKKPKSKKRSKSNKKSNYK